MSEQSSLSMDQRLTDQREQEWRETVSGHLYTQLAERAEREQKQLQVKNKGSIVETFIYGDERAIILKQLEDATVGDANGKLVAYTEAYQYKQFTWWREAVDAQQGAIRFLNTPILVAAQEAGLREAPEAFRVPTIMATFPGHEQESSLQTWVKERIETVTGAALAPQYKVTFTQHTLRMMPLTPEAAQDMASNGSIYQEAQARLANVAHELLDAYAQKRAELGL